MGDYTHQLPVELCYKVLDSLDLADIIRVSLLCHCWRLLAFDHPTYWASVSVVLDSECHHTAPERAFSLATAQLERSSRSPIAIRIHRLPLVARPYEGQLLPLIKANMHRVKYLNIESGSPLLRDILLADAPVLEELRLHWCGWSSMILPAIFPDTAPRLRLLKVAELPLEPTSRHTFASLTTLIASTGFCNGLCLPIVFPHLRVLVLAYGHGPYTPPTPLDVLWGPWITQLDHISVDQGNAEILHSANPAFASVRRVEVIMDFAISTGRCISALLSGSALRAQFQSAGEYSLMDSEGLQLFDPSTGRTRVLRYGETTDILARIRPLLPRITTLELSVSSWVHFTRTIKRSSARLDFLSNLTALTLLLDQPIESLLVSDDDDRVDGLGGFGNLFIFKCPKLRVLHLVGTDACRVQPVYAVAHFICWYLSEVKGDNKLSHIEMEDVELEGNIEELLQYVTTV